MQRYLHSSTDRAPAVAGRFYPSGPNSLYKEIKKLYENVETPTDLALKKQDPLAIVVPHAGYIFSGRVAASAFAYIKSTKFDRVFLIGSSHSHTFNGASVYEGGNYITPLGKIAVDKNIVRHLLKSDKVFNYLPEAHVYEHSLEVQLPFLQYKLGSRLKIVPVLLGLRSPSHRSCCYQYRSFSLS